jgi:isopenicillin-N epimerase
VTSARPEVAARPAAPATEDPRGQSDQRPQWTLDPSIVFLNHGSFGACPEAVQAAQAGLRAALERDPVRFFLREVPPLLDASRTALAEFLGAPADDLVFVRNATTAVNTVLAGLTLEPGDELLTTDHAYNACRNALDETARRTGARVVVAPIPFPVPLVGGTEVALAAVLDRVSARTRLALLDHVTSSTGLVLPMASLCAALAERGIETLVDGAHAPGMVPLDLGRLGATYYTGNCHKWLCAPKGAAFLYVQREGQERLRPLVISHGANTPEPGRSRFQVEFGWTGTDDPTAYACVAVALRHLGGALPGGWPALMEHNHALACTGRRILCEALGIAPPSPEEMLGSLATVPLPDFPAFPVGATTGAPGSVDQLQEALYSRYQIEVPVFPWPRGSQTRLLRISAQLYNQPEQYQYLARALMELGAERTPGS